MWGGHPNDFELRLEAWHSRNSAWDSILMLQTHVPIYGTYGSSAVFVYEFMGGRAVTLEEQREMLEEECTEAEAALWAGDYLEKGRHADDVVFKGWFDGYLLFDVTVRADGGDDGWTHLYATYDMIDEVEIIDEDQLREILDA